MDAHPSVVTGVGWRPLVLVQHRAKTVLPGRCRGRLRRVRMRLQISRKSSMTPASSNSAATEFHYRGRNLVGAGGGGVTQTLDRLRDLAGGERRHMSDGSPCKRADQRGD
eukprot:jgi/Mesvir1/21971/Mv26476-RA.1